MESILISIKKLLGIEEGYENFDTDIIIHINTVFSTLTQLGVGPNKGYSIKDETATWNDYLKGDERLESVKTYVYLRVKMIFDPPSASSVAEAYNRTIQELEWRLNVAAETTHDEYEEDIDDIEYEKLDDGTLNLVVPGLDIPEDTK